MSTAGKLKGIKFAHVEAMILSVEYSPRVLVSWGLEKTTQDTSKLFFDIYRGESPTEMTKISTALIPANEKPEFIDTTAKLKIASKLYYYQVVAKELLGDIVVQEFKSPLATWDGEQDHVSQYIIDEHNFAYEHVHGVPTFIYQKRKEGVRCTNCWDKVLKRVLISSCQTCYGTGFMGGYYPPMPAWMDFSPDPTTAVVVEFGVREPSQTDVALTNYPILQLGDIILELDSFAFWRVVAVRTSEKNRAITLQFARVDQVNRSDIENQISVNQELRKKMMGQLNQRQALPEF